MITIIASLVGFLTSSLPSILKLFQDRQERAQKLEQDKQDKAHELTILEKQIELQKLGHQDRLEEIKVEGQSKEMVALYNSVKPTGTWTDSLNASVRPVISYGMFFTYLWNKWRMFQFLDPTHPEFHFMIETLWDNQDMAALSVIISFYFGARYFDRKISK